MPQHEAPKVAESSTEIRIASFVSGRKILGSEHKTRLCAAKWIRLVEWAGEEAGLGRHRKGLDDLLKKRDSSKRLYCQ